MRIGAHEYANEADDDDDDIPKPAQSLGTPVPRQKGVCPTHFMVAHQWCVNHYSVLCTLKAMAHCRMCTYDKLLNKVILYCADTEH